MRLFNLSLSTFSGAGALLLLLGDPISVLRASPASPGEDKSEDAAAAEEGDPVLPVWEEGACREAFDVRIWPLQTLTWLEQENLRDLIADESRSESERAELKRILAMQRAWRVKGPGNDKGS